MRRNQSKKSGTRKNLNVTAPEDHTSSSAMVPNPNGNSEMTKNLKHELQGSSMRSKTRLKLNTDQVQWLILVIPALWEAKAGDHSRSGV